MKRVLYFIIHVIGSVALGTAIYIGWRDQDMWVNRWIDAIGANWLVFRSDFPLPGWVINSLPDGCWVYAYTSWMLMIWRRMNLWVMTGVILAVGGELGQLNIFGFQLVPGTYDNMDMVCYLGAFFLSWVIYAKTAPVVGRRGGHHGGAGDRQHAASDDPRHLAGRVGDGNHQDGNHQAVDPVIPTAGEPARS